MIRELGEKGFQVPLPIGNYSRQQGFQESREVLAEEAGISSDQLGKHGSVELTELIPCDGGCVDMDMDFREISWGAGI